MIDDTRELKSAIDDLQGRLHEEIQLRTELERRCHLLEKLAYRDPSTGLKTEHYLHARVHEEIERSIRYPSSASLVTVCAPKEREEMLPKLGMRLSNELRSSDQVFTLNHGGLAILLIETPEEGARRVIDRIGAELEQFIKGYGYTVTSFPVDANLAEDFMNLALERHHDVVNHVQADPVTATLPSHSQSVH